MRLKINDYCEFPETINFRPWTKEGIRERERSKHGDPEEGSVVAEQERPSRAAPIDEDLESSQSEGEGSDELMIEEEDNVTSIMDTGKYFDEGVMEDFIDIAADDDDAKKKQKPFIKPRSESQ